MTKLDRVSCSPPPVGVVRLGEPAFDEAVVWLLVRELAADACARLGSVHGPERVRVAHKLTRDVRLEMGICESGEAVALGDVLDVIERALTDSQVIR